MAIAARRAVAIGSGLPPLHIVSLADRGVTGKIRQRDWLAFAQRIGRGITFEHICLPPSPVLVSDLLFLEQFPDDVAEDAFRAVADAARRLRAASFLIVDDVAEMAIPGSQAYAALSHARVRDPRTDLITVRRQRYPALHHCLPTTFVAGIDLPLDDRTASLDRLSGLLGKPIFRIATIGLFEEYTRDWDFRRVETPGGSCGGRDAFAPGDLLDALAHWIAARDLSPPPSPPDAAFDVSDLGHFCSHLVSRDALDRVFDRYARFCLAGQAASVPYARAALAARDKPFVLAPHYTPEALAGLGHADYDVILAFGPQGSHATPVPVVAVDDTGPLPNPADTLSYTVKPADMPPSATDWNAPTTFARAINLPLSVALATSLQRDAPAIKARRRLHRETLAGRVDAPGNARAVASEPPDRSALQRERRAARQAEVAVQRAAVVQRRRAAQRRRDALSAPAAR